jgi:hypothetical protein
MVISRTPRAFGNPYGVSDDRRFPDYEGGNGAKHSLISPSEATSYLTMSGKSLPKYISKWLHNGVHLMKWLNDFRENSP